jgi:hypothetical protein
MRMLTQPLSLVLATVAVTSFLFLRLPALAALAAVAWVGVLVFSSILQFRRQVEEDPTEELRPESRSLLRPLKRLREEMHEIVERHPENAAARVLGQEALEEAGRIVRQCARSLKAREELRRLVGGRYEAEKDAASLEERAGATTATEERLALLSALEARRAELEQYDALDVAVAKIDGLLRQAEAALSEMRARLAVAVSGESAEVRPDQELRESLGRLKALSVSADEVEEFLRP